MNATSWEIVWANGSLVTFATIPAKPYRPVRPQRPWGNDGNSYFPMTAGFANRDRLFNAGDVYGHPRASTDLDVAVAHDVTLGPVVVDMQTGDRWPL